MKKILMLFVLVFISYGSLQAQSDCIRPLVRVKSTVDSIKASYQDVLSDIVLIKKEGENFPLDDLEAHNYGFLVYKHIDEWQNYILRYADFPVYNGNDESIIKKIENDSIEHLIVMSEDQGLIDHDWLDALTHTNKSFALLGDNSILPQEQLNQFDNILWLPESTSNARDLCVQAVFGALDITGRLKFNLSEEYKADCGIDFIATGRLTHLPAENIGINSELIKLKVDSFIQSAIDSGAFPGCRILVAIKGNVIFNNSYGYHTYNKRIEVRQHDVYDLASVTKIAGPLPLIMKACDDDLIDLDQPFSDYWTDWKPKFFHRSNKGEIIFRDVLAHQANLTPYINYYPMTLIDKTYDNKWYSLNRSDKHPIKIDDHLYLSRKFKKEVYKLIRKSELLTGSHYKYSGLSYMIYPELLSILYNDSYEKVLYNSFFKPLGASSLRYNPIGKLDQNRIVPTEYDFHFRKKQIKGLVHDEAAAIMGGISGNAGLFSTADDLAKLMQMYLNNGTYAGKRYISKNTLDNFVKVQFPDNNNRRGAGFDKPLFGNDTLSITNSYPAPSVSTDSYGHSGFTGTFVWIDPEYELIYIFLSNRVYPTRENRLIYQMNVRPIIQQIFYDALSNSN